MFCIYIIVRIVIDSYMYKLNHKKSDYEYDDANDVNF